MGDLEQKIIALIAQWQNRAEALELEVETLLANRREDDIGQCKSKSVEARIYRACAKALANKTGVLK